MLQFFGYCWLTKLNPTVSFKYLNLPFRCDFKHTIPLCCHGYRFGPSWVTEKSHSTGSCLNTHVHWVSPCSRRTEKAGITAFPQQGKPMYQMILRAGEIAHSRDRLPLTVTMENESNSGFNDPR